MKSLNSFYVILPLLFLAGCGNPSGSAPQAGGGAVPTPVPSVPMNVLYNNGAARTTASDCVATVHFSDWIYPSLSCDHSEPYFTRLNIPEGSSIAWKADCENQGLAFAGSLNMTCEETKYGDPATDTAVYSGDKCCVVAPPAPPPPDPFPIPGRTCFVDSYTNYPHQNVILSKKPIDPDTLQVILNGVKTMNYHYDTLKNELTLTGVVPLVLEKWDIEFCLPGVAPSPSPSPSPSPTPTPINVIGI